MFETVPSHMLVILDEIEVNSQIAKKFKKLCWLILNGEALVIDICQRWFKVYVNIPILNAYGPTECSDDVTHFKIFDLSYSLSVNMPIGNALANTKIYILDQNLSHVPIGVAGEIFIGGIGVGRGYLNQARLTAEKFIPNPFVSAEEYKQGENLRLYRTGDLGCYTDNGIIKFLGRIDVQTKIEELE